MGFFKTLLIFLIFSVSVFAEEKILDKRHVLYLMYTNEIERSFAEYQQICKTDKCQDFEILQQMSLILLRNGAKDADADIQKMTMFGAGLAASNNSLDILETGINSPDIQTQMISLHFIAQIQDDRVDDLLTKAMSSDFLPTRLEAAHAMAQRKHPHAIGQIESLMHRLPHFVKPYFPSLFALIGTPDATNILRKFLNDANPDVRVETILNIARFNRDDLLPYIKKRIISSNIAEQEACCFALAQLKDSSSLDKLQKLASSNIENVKVAALKALYNLGEISSKNQLQEMAKNHDLFAIATLADIKGSEETLAALLNSNKLDIKINAASSLLKRKDKRCLPLLKEIFIRDVRDIALQPGFSLGRSISYWKIVYSAKQQAKEKKIDLGVAQSIKEYLLRDTVELDEDSFLYVANMIFNNNQNDLVPLLINLLENVQSEKTISLLKEMSNKSGNPLIRDYCHLALFRLKQEGSYETYIANWIQKQKQNDLIQLNPSQNTTTNKNDNLFNLSIEEKTQLLIDMYTALATKQDQKSIAIVIDAIRKGNPKNRYALAGLLIRATE